MGKGESGGRRLRPCLRAGRCQLLSPSLAHQSSYILDVGPPTAVCETVCQLRAEGGGEHSRGGERRTRRREGGRQAGGTSRQGIHTQGQPLLEAAAIGDMGREGWEGQYHLWVWSLWVAAGLRRR